MQIGLETSQAITRNDTAGNHLDPLRKDMLQQSRCKETVRRFAVKLQSTDSPRF